MGKTKIQKSKSDLKVKPVKTKKTVKKTVNDKVNVQSADFPGSSVVLANPSTGGLRTDWNLKFVSWNVNGLRASLKHKSLLYVEEENADIIAVQETKCALADLPKEVNSIKRYQTFWSSAEKSGYAGTGLFSKTSPIKVTYGIGSEEHDQEGRVITAEYEKFYFVNAYVPNSGRGLVRLEYRQNQWDRDFCNYLRKLDENKPVIVCGDLNVSHLDIDLANPKSNSKTAGFTKEERDGFSELLRSADLVDTFRHIYPDRIGAYTFWSNMHGSRGRNIGWRLDYFLISRRLLPCLCNHEIRSSVMGSDHCPIVLYMKI